MKRQLPWVLVLAIAGAALAEQGKSGRYGRADEAVYVLTGQNDAYVSYAIEWHRTRSCGCLLHGVRQADGSYSFENDPEPAGSFTIDAQGFRFRLKGSLSCCGDGWAAPNRPLAFSGPPTTCTVKSERAIFYDDPVKQMEHHPYVQRGDVVNIVPAPATAEGMGPFVVARFQGPKKTTMGLLKRDDLDCPRP
jgi:hypothetical protein